MTRRAFTLIELIIASVISAVIIVSVCSAFTVGIRAWRKGGEGRDTQKVRIALLKMQRELRSSFFFSKAPFKGSSSEISFPLVRAGEGKDDIRIVNYYALENKNADYKSLVKRETIFTDEEFLEKEETDAFIFAADLISFEYVYESKDKLKGFEWKAVWEESQKKLPLAVRVNFRLKANEDIYHKVIFIAQGALGTE